MSLNRLIAYAVTAVALATAASAEPVKIAGRPTQEIKVHSSAFNQDGLIPQQYTCDGEDASPALEWENVPQGAKSLALIVDDPDAPGKTWTHWVVYNLPVSTVSLAASMPLSAKLANGTRQGRNDFGRSGYGGPCPPTGQTHRYFFTIYALDQMLNLENADRHALDGAIKGHILADGKLMGRYSRE